MASSVTEASHHQSNSCGCCRRVHVLDFVVLVMGCCCFASIQFFIVGKGNSSSGFCGIRPRISSICGSELAQGWEINNVNSFVFIQDEIPTDTWENKNVVWCLTELIQSHLTHSSLRVFQTHQRLFLSVMTSVTWWSIPAIPVSKMRSNCSYIKELLQKYLVVIVDEQFLLAMNKFLLDHWNHSIIAILGAYDDLLLKN